MKNWLKRALRTAFQTAVSYIAIAIPSVDWGADRAVIRAALTGIFMSALSGGIAAAMNINEDEEDEDEE